MPPVVATTAPSKEALCIVIDVSHSVTAQGLAAMKQVAGDFIVQKMLFSPSDEIGLIFAGTDGARNRLNAASPSHFRNVTVMRPVMRPTGDYLRDVEAAGREGGPIDMFEAILCAADLITEATADKKYKRRILLMSSIADPVKNKGALGDVQQGLAAKGISLTVAGVDFTVSDSQDWSTLTTTKQQNERVIAIVCHQLGEDSFVFSIEDAMAALANLRKRNVSERTSSRTILTIGDVKIAVYIYTKTLQARIPTLKKGSTAASSAASASTADAGVRIDRRYFVAATMEEVEPAERIKVLKYGRSVVPCAACDEEQMKFVSDRGLDCLGFVNISDIPPHILTGGCKAVGPAIGDGEGAAALAAFVQGMVHANKAMLCRYVRCANAAPVVCACFPSAKAERHILYMVPLPFAEDFRRYLLPDYANVSLSPAEEGAIDAMVSAMALSETDMPRLSKIHNPSLQQYYAWVGARYLRSQSLASAEGVHQSHVAPEKVIGTPLPQMPAAVLEGATRWGEEGNALHDKIASSAAARALVARAFPFTAPSAANAPGKADKAFWFGQQGAVATASASASASGGGDGYEPPTSRGRRSEGGGPSASSASAAGSASENYLSTQATALSSAATQQQQHHQQQAPQHTGRAAAAISTANPVESFLAMVGNKSLDLVDEAIFRMGELVLTLLRLSIGAQFFTKCEDCVRALRRVCVDEDEPAAYFAFLQRLVLMTKGGAHDAFWTQSIVAAGLGPITAEESPASTVTPQEALRFLTEGIRAPAPPVLDEEAGGADDLLDLLE